MAQVIEFPSGAERSATILRKEPMTMAQVIAERLKRLREARGLTQGQLAKKARGVNPRTISRLENGECSPHRRTIERLAKALEVDPEVLTGERPMPPGIGQPSAPAEDVSYQLNVRLPAPIRNAYELAARRYGVSVSKIAQLAPLLFVIVAEASLKLRGDKLDACSAKHKELEEAASQMPYLDLDIGLYEDNLMEFVAEEDSIAAKDVFGRWLLKATPPEGANPFVTSLKTLAEQYTGDEAAVNAVGPGSTDYRVCRSAAVKLAGGDEALADSILNGEVPIHQIPRGLSPEQRIAWMRENKRPLPEIEDGSPEEVPEELLEYGDPLGY
jgi:transcriptional regulator with XRE-family HTH domain